MLLEVKGLEAGYGPSQILFGISFGVTRGEVVTLLGRNGMGKSTTVNTISGLCAARGGSILFEGTDITGSQPHRIARLGVGIVPEGRRIFPNLTVRENLLVAINQNRANGGWDVEAALDFFPRLNERLGNGGRQLSGGEQQMLAIARALLINPKLLILDEATEGLAPLIRAEIWECLKRLRGAGISMIVIDKDIAAISQLADRHYIVEKGQIVWQGTSDDLIADGAAQSKYLGVG